MFVPVALNAVQRGVTFEAYTLSHLHSMSRPTQHANSIKARLIKLGKFLLYPKILLTPTTKNDGVI